MIVCKLMGGLGNQMFQYAYAMSLSKELNDKVCFDTNLYDDNDPALFKLNIKEKNTTQHIPLIDFTTAKKMAKIYHVLQYVIRKLNHERIGCNLFHILSKHGYYFNFDPFYYPSIKSKKENKYILSVKNGYRPRSIRSCGCVL